MTEVRALSGRAAITVRLASAPDVVTAVVHLETRAGRVAALRVSRDPMRLMRLLPAPAA